jgi:hypothetical protein
MVVVADCAGAAPVTGPVFGSPFSFAGTVEVRGQAAVDVQTGLILANSMGLTMVGSAANPNTGAQQPVAARFRIVSSLE